MNTILTMDKAGRVVLPKPLRDELQLSAGDALRVESSGNHIVLSPLREAAEMRQREGIWVFRVGEPVSTASVNETIHRIRKERDQAPTSKGEKQRTPK